MQYSQRLFSQSYEPIDHDASSTVPSIQFKPETADSAYRATFRCPDGARRKDFVNTRFIMPISIGQKFHENGRITSTLKLVNKTFSSGVILVDDVIQRHTRKILNPALYDDELYESCLSDGDEWIRQYTPYFEEILEIDYKVIRWERWLKHEDFPAARERVESLLKTDVHYFQAFSRNINELIGRLFERNPSLDYKLAHKQYKTYLIEECAAMLLWNELDVDVEVSPSDRNHATSITNKLLIKKLDLKRPEGLKHLVLIFKKISPINAEKEKNLLEEEDQQNLSLST